MNKTLHGDGQPSICLIKHVAITTYEVMAV